MDKNKNFVNLILSLEEKHIEEIALVYLSEIEGYERFLKTKDENVDSEFENPQKVIQYHIIANKNKSIQESEFFRKVKSNIEKFNLPNKVFLFISQPFDENQIILLKKQAKEKHDIMLNVIDSVKLADDAEIYDEISALLYEKSNLNKFDKTNQTLNDERVKTFYDLMTFGASTDIKYNIIKAFVFNYLCSNESATKTNILNKINEAFSSKIELNYFDYFLNKLKTEDKIVIEHENVSLSIDAKKKITSVLDRHQAEMNVLTKKLSIVLQKYKLESSINEFISHLSEIYESDYAINLAEFTHKNSNINPLNKTTKKLKKFIERKIGDRFKVNDILHELMNAIEDNDYLLKKIAAGKFYSKINDPDKIQRYINENINNKYIFLDTNVLIYLVFVDYEIGLSDDDYKYKEAKHFLKFIQKNALKLKTVRGYSIELAYIFKEALSIVPFTRLPVFESMGGSRNLVYLFFSKLKKQNLLDKEINSFERFLKEFKFEIKSLDPEYKYQPQIGYLLSNLNIEVEEQNREELEIVLPLISGANHIKSHPSAVNDAKMFKRLGSSDVDLNPMDPIFCTWDFSLNSARAKYFEEFPNCTKWFMFTPYRLMDHFSMMNFQLKTGSISNEVLSILDDGNEFSSMTYSLLDSIKTIINPENKIGLQYTNKLAALRQREIIQIEHKEDRLKDSKFESTAVDILFTEIHKHYFFHQDNSKIGLVKNLFTSEKYFDEILALLTNASEQISKPEDFNPEIFKELDDLIEKERVATI